MDNHKKNQETDREDSGTKHASGSKKVHSEQDNSTKDGIKPTNSKK